MRLKSVTNLVLGVVFILCGVAAIYDCYDHRLRSGRPMTDYDSYVFFKSGLLILGGLIGLWLAFAKKKGD